MLKRWIVLAFLLAGCNDSKTAAPAAPPAETPAAPDPAAQAAQEEALRTWMAKRAVVASIEKELEQTQVAITIYRENVLGNKGQVTTEATIKEAHERLPMLEADKARLEAKLAEAKAEEAKYRPGGDASRTKGIPMSEECKKNPLAKGCS